MSKSVTGDRALTPVQLVLATAVLVAVGATLARSQARSWTQVAFGFGTFAAFSGIAVALGAIERRRGRPLPFACSAAVVLALGLGMVLVAQALVHGESPGAPGGLLQGVLAGAVVVDLYARWRRDPAPAPAAGPAELEHRRVRLGRTLRAAMGAVVVALLAAAAGLALGSGVPAFLCLPVLILTMTAVHQQRCPRCDERFFVGATASSPLAGRCRHCSFDRRRAVPG